MSAAVAGRPAWRWLLVAYAWLAYFLYARSLLYLIGFLAGWRVAKTIDGGAGPWPRALLVDLTLLVAFAVPHSLLARPDVKQRLWGPVPPAAERSTYVLVSALSLAALIALWQPWPRVLWQVEAPALCWLLWTLFASGWLLGLAATKTHGHFRLFGVRAAWREARGQPAETPRLRTTGLYAHLRHPMYLGFLVGCWVTPSMTAGHALFAAVMTAYALLGARLEERDLAARFGEEYAAYRRRVAAVGWKLKGSSPPAAGW